MLNDETNMWTLQFTTYEPISSSQTHSPLQNKHFPSHFWCFNRLTISYLTMKEGLEMILLIPFGCKLEKVSIGSVGSKVMKVWQKIILLPSSIAICEWEFSKQNAIESHFAICWTWNLLLLCMWCSLWTWSGCNGLGYYLQYIVTHVRPKNTTLN